MKQVFAICLGALMGVQASWGASPCKLGNTPLEKYTIVYQAQADADEGIDRANALQAEVREAVGVVLPVKSSDEFKKGASIRIEKPSGMTTFDYTLDVGKGKAVVGGGCGWAIDRAAGMLVEKLKSGANVAPFKARGSVEGEFLFPRGEGVTLRILDDNIWDYSLDTIPDEWKQAGLDCRDVARAPEFAQLVRGYMPEVVTLQEYSRHMDAEFYPLIKKYGYRNACDSKDGAWNNTPIFYDSDSLELLDVNYNLYTPSRWSNHASKSFTSAVFRQKSTGKVFAVINTHLWWKSDKVQAGSTQARASQVRLIMAEAEIIERKYSCPVFVTGDMNCEEDSVPMQQFIAGGYVPCYMAATVYGNTDNGHHECAPRTPGTRKSNRKGADRRVGAIDHCFIHNARSTEVKRFDCLQDFFTVKLTDHYPNLIDVAL